MFLGRSSDGFAFAQPERSVLVLGPSRSGKTSSFIIPNLLVSDRAVVATSTKDDVVRHMVDARRDVATLVFDPSGATALPHGATRVGYSPLRLARDWDGAVLVARALVDSSRPFAARGADHWSERASALLAPLLHDAALDERSAAQLVESVDRRRGDAALERLERLHGEHHPAVGLLSGVLATEDRERSSIWSTCSGLLQALQTHAARAAAREAPLDVDAFLDGAHHLHIVSPSRHQRVAAPLVIGLIDEIVETTYRRHRDGARVLLALDELANVAPLPQLASIVSEGGGQGVTTLACLQDLSQARTRWGEQANGFLSLFPTTVVLPGIADRSTLELLQHLAGRELIEQPSAQLDRRGRVKAHSTSWQERDRTTLAHLAHGRAGYAMTLDDKKHAHRVHLAPAHSDALFRTYRERASTWSPREISR